MYKLQYDNIIGVYQTLGLEINVLPAGAKLITIDGQEYYELNGVYYQPITKDDGTTAYIIAGKDGQLSTGNGSQDNGGNIPQDNGGKSPPKKRRENPPQQQRGKTPSNKTLRYHP